MVILDGRKARTAKKRKLIVNPKRRRLAKTIKYSKGRGGKLTFIINNEFIDNYNSNLFPFRTP